jgi:hypothetical protein
MGFEFWHRRDQPGYSVSLSNVQKNSHAFTSDENLTPIATVEYDDGRRQIQRGDVFMERGRSLKARTVRWTSRLRYSHAGLTGWWNDRRMVVTAFPLLKSVGVLRKGG